MILQPTHTNCLVSANDMHEVIMFHLVSPWWVSSEIPWCSLAPSFTSHLINFVSAWKGVPRWNAPPPPSGNFHPWKHMKLIWFLGSKYLKCVDFPLFQQFCQVQWTGGHLMKIGTLSFASVVHSLTTTSTGATALQPSRISLGVTGCHQIYPNFVVKQMLPQPMKQGLDHVQKPGDPLQITHRPKVMCSKFELTLRDRTDATFRVHIGPIFGVLIDVNMPHSNAYQFPCVSCSISWLPVYRLMKCRGKRKWTDGFVYWSPKYSGTLEVHINWFLAEIAYILVVARTLTLWLCCNKPNSAVPHKAKAVCHFVVIKFPIHTCFMYQKDHFICGFNWNENWWGKLHHASSGQIVSCLGRQPCNL